MANNGPANVVRWQRYHADPDKWFWRRVDRREPDECWPWLGRIMANRGGYGRLTFDGRWIGAHRMALKLATGEEPEGKFACHHCDNPICCNPHHLFWGTHLENVADCVNKGRARGGSRKIDLDNLVRRRAEGAPYSVLAQEFGVNQASIGKALQRAALRARGQP